MKTTILMTTCCLMLAAVSPAAAGTKVSGNLVPVPADCYTGPGFCKNGLAGPPGDCGGDNMLCQGASTAVAKMSLSDKLQIKVAIKGLADNNGTLVTTNPLDPNDDHLLKVSLNRCLADSGIPTNCQNPMTVYVRLDLTEGKGKATGDLTAALTSDPSRTGVTLIGAQLAANANTPAGCTGSNAAHSIAARVDDSDCDNGLPYAALGVLKR